MTYPIDDCDFYMRRKIGSEILIKDHVHLCDWRNREITTSEMQLGLNLREVHDFMTDAFLILKCEISDVTLKKKTLDCPLVTVDSTYNDQVFRAWFDWRKWYAFSREYNIWLVSSVIGANTGTFMIDSSATANSLWVFAFDLLELYNYTELWYKVGLEYGYTT